MGFHSAICNDSHLPGDPNHGLLNQPSLQHGTPLFSFGKSVLVFILWYMTRDASPSLDYMNIHYINKRKS